MALSEPVLVTPNDKLIAAHSGSAGAAVRGNRDSRQIADQGSYLHRNRNVTSDHAIGDREADDIPSGDPLRDAIARIEAVTAGATAGRDHGRRVHPYI